MPSRSLRAAGWMVAILLLLSGCASNTVRTTSATPILSGDPSMPEDQLLDVGVRLFDPGLEHIEEEEDITTRPEIREAEARYFPSQLVDTLQRTGHWGAVRIVPRNTGFTDVVVEGTIIESNGEKLVLEIKAGDSSGREWYVRRYEGLASKYSYQGTRPTSEPFQDVYNRIANDLAVYRGRFSEAAIRELRTISELRFAESFSPEAFGGFLKQNEDGEYQIARLPAEGDPMLQRIRTIRERDYLFVDTLQDYYTDFSRRMGGPYQEWRRQSFEETIAYRQLRNESTTRTVAGVAAILAGIAAAGSDNGSTRAAGTVGILGGAALIKSGFDKRTESEMHAEAMREIGGSLDAEITPQMIDLQDQTVTLSGTVDDQYGQWRQILKGIYAQETGSIQD